MNKRTTYYATFHAPGAFVGESWSRDVPTPDPLAVAWPDNAYAFTMFKREDVIDGDRIYTGKPEQIGKTFYHPHSMVQSYEQAQSNPKATRILLDNMRINGWSHIVWTRWGNWPQPFDAGTNEVLAGKPEEEQ